MEMQNIFLMRHGEAEDYSSSGDQGRILTKVGVQKIKKTSSFILNQNYSVDEIWASPFQRARQTAGIISNALGFTQRQIILKEHATPSSSFDPITKDITFTENNIWLVSHLPFIPNLASELLTSRTQFNISPGSIIHLGRYSFGQFFLQGFYSAEFITQQSI